MTEEAAWHLFWCIICWLLLLVGFAGLALCVFYDRRYNAKHGHPPEGDAAIVHFAGPAAAFLWIGSTAGFLYNIWQLIAQLF